MCTPRHLFVCLILGLNPTTPAQTDSLRDHRLTVQRVPIHSQAEDSVGGPYGTWAAGMDYKVSFGREISYFPMLGAAYKHNLPFTWRTVGVRAGAFDLLPAGDAFESASTDWQWVLRHGNVEERWDVRPNGLELSFVIPNQPACEGDLVVRGRITSDLVAAHQEPMHGPIAFHAFDGRPIVNYGEAFVLDANGNVAPIATGFDGQELTLHVPQAFLATATYPITIDPLLTRFRITTHADPPGAADIARDDENDHRLVTWTRRSSLSDWDLWSILVTDAGSHVTLHYADVSANWSTTAPSAGHIAGADCWALAFERYFPFFDRARIRCHVRSDGVSAPPGPVLEVTENPDRHHRYPTISVGAGFSTIDRALLVFQQDTAPTLQNTNNSQIVGTFVDGTSRMIEPSLFFVSSTVGDLDCEFPSASRSVSGFGDTWLVIWQQYDNAIANDDWDVWGRQINPGGAFSQTWQLEGASRGSHALYPKVDGRDGRFLVYHGESSRSGKNHGDSFSALVLQRVDWPFGWTPTFPHSTVMHQSALNIFSYGEPNARPMAYDTETASHWGIGSIATNRMLTLERVGYDLGVVESHVAYNVPLELVRSVSITHDDDHDAFAAFFTVQDQGAIQPVFMQDFAFENARSLYYGTGCIGNMRAVNSGVGDRPHAGSEFFAVALENGLPNVPTGLFVSEAAASLPVGNGCELLLDPAHFFLLASGTSDAIGQMNVSIPLPTEAFARGDVYWQWIQFDPSTGTLLGSNGLLTEIR